MLPLQNDTYAARLEEKLQRMADKRGGDESEYAKELKHIKPAESVTSQKRASVTEKKSTGKEE
jgi:hypothetical protein